MTLNYTCKSHEMNVLCEPCVCDDDGLILSDAAPQRHRTWEQENKHKNIIQNAKLAHFMPDIIRLKAE